MALNHAYRVRRTSLSSLKRTILVSLGSTELCDGWTVAQKPFLGYSFKAGVSFLCFVLFCFGFFWSFFLVYFDSV